MVHRLPTPGSDDGTWGDVLNDFLAQEHNADGTQKALDPSKITGTAEVQTNKDQSNGYAGLDSSGKLKVVELPSIVAPAVFTMTGASAPNGFVQNPVTFLSVVDPIWQIGYNVIGLAGHVTSEPQFYVGIEGAYKIASGNEGWDNTQAHVVNEFYVNYTSPDNSTVVSYRPIYIGVLRDSNSSNASHIFFDIGTAGFPNSQFIVQAGAGNTILTIVNNLVSVASGVSLQVGGANVKTVPSTAITEFAVKGANPFTTTRTANTLYGGAVQVDNTVTLTGVSVYNGGTANGNLIVALYNSAGTRVALSNSTVQTGTFISQFIPFTATYSASPGTYYLCLIPSSSTATFSTIQTFTNGIAVAQGSFAAPGSITVPVVNSTQSIPAMSTY